MRNAKRERKCDGGPRASKEKKRKKKEERRSKPKGQEAKGRIKKKKWRWGGVGNWRRREKVFGDCKMKEKKMRMKRAEGG